MDREALEYFKNKKVKVYLKDRIVYSGYIQQIFEDSFIFLDKYNTTIAIPYSQIERMEEVKDEKPA